MQDLNRTLSDYDIELLRVIANRWDVDLSIRDPKQAAEHLAKAMLSADKAVSVWDRLTDEQRGALQALLGAGGKMPGVVFSRLYGEIRPMGPGKLEREKPYLNPVSLAEALYYRGLLATTFGEGKKVSQAWFYVPTDLIPLLPIHKTGYDLTPVEQTTVSGMKQPENIKPADTIIVDDLTTLLAYLQLNDVKLLDTSLPPDHQRLIKPYLIGSNSAARLALLIALASGIGLASDTHDGFKPVGNTARRWLDLPRAEQVRTLAEAWRDSAVYNELFYTPGIKPERGANWQNDPLLARQTVLTFLEMVPADQWWTMDTFVNAVKEDEPDFQRPAGDYDSWYIKDAQTGKYLKGFESWEKVDGAVLRFILIGPMHGLGLVDLADNGAACRLTAYGRAFTGAADWPASQPDNPAFTIQADGTCEVPRTVSRFDRFQLARFTEWIKAGDPFVYRISTEGLTIGGEQGIESGNILPFLKRATGDQIPEPVINLIEMWGQAGSEAAVIEQVTVLRVPTEELMETIQATPSLRRYLGARLGPTAVVVREGQWNDLATALEANGVLVQIGVIDRQ